MAVTREQKLAIFAFLAPAAVTGIGFALGGTLGATILGGIGINLSTEIILHGATKLKEKWFGSANGILNHDIQNALVRGFIKSLASLEERYFRLEETNELSKEKKKSIKALFQELKDEAPTIFIPSIEEAVNEPEIKCLLYGDPLEAQKALWERIEGTKLIYTYYGEHFKNFLRENCSDEIVFWFGEELKTDDKENNKAWRAFQRMLLEGIQADVKSIKAGQDEIKHDLKTLAKIRKQLLELKDTVDRRHPNEPFQESFVKAVTEIKTALQDIARDTTHIRARTDVIEAGVKKLLDEKTEIELPPIPGDVNAFFDQAFSLQNSGKYKEAKKVLQKALSLATRYKDRRAIAATKRAQAIILTEFERDNTAAKALLLECLNEFRELNDEKYLATTLYELGANEIAIGNLDQAEGYLCQALEFDRKNNKKGDAAGTLHQLGWIEDHRGNLKKSLEFYDDALNLNLGIHDESKSESDRSQSIGNCYHHKGLAYKKMGMAEDAESNFKKALDWYRRADYKLGIGLIQFLRAGLKISEADYDEGVKYLDEATNLFKETKDTRHMILCLDLRGRLHYTLGQEYLAIPCWKAALAIAEKAGDYENQVEYLNKLGHIFLNDDEIEKAIDNFRKAREISLREGLLQDYAETVEKLAKIAEIENNKSERDELLADGIKNLEKLLLTLQAEPRRAYITGQIGFFYERMENFQQAKVHYQKAKIAFEAISDIHGIANCLGSIARMKRVMRDEGGEFQTYSELKTLVDGTPYYDLIAGSAINLANTNLDCGNVDEAKRMLQEAEFLCRKYNLECLPQLEKSLRRLKSDLEIRKPPTMTFKELVEECFELVDWFPEAKTNLLALWIYGRDHDLYVNYRQTVGVKFMACQDDLDIFLRASEILFPYYELCLQFVTSQYNDALNIVPFPKDKKLFASQYTFTSDSATSKTSGKEGCVLIGWTRGLPEQANELILSRTAAELFNKKIFFIPYGRYLANDKFLSDLRFGKELGSIFLYFGSLPISEDVGVLHSAKIDLPILTADDADSQRKQIRKVKHSLMQLLSVSKDSALSALNNFVFETEELTDACNGNESLKIQTYILEFPYGLKKDFHIAIVIQSPLNKVDLVPYFDETTKSTANG